MDFCFRVHQIWLATHRNLYIANVMQRVTRLFLCILAVNVILMTFQNRVCFAKRALSVCMYVLWLNKRSREKIKKKKKNYARSKNINLSSFVRSHSTQPHWIKCYGCCIVHTYIASITEKKGTAKNRIFRMRWMKEREKTNKLYENKVAMREKRKINKFHPPENVSQTHNNGTSLYDAELQAPRQC